MNDKFVYKMMAFGVACSIAFISGYIFRGNYGGDNQPIMNAIQAASSTNEVLDSLYSVEMNMNMYDDISPINSMDKIKPLQDKYRERTLGSIHMFDKRSKDSISERRRSVFSVFDEKMIGYKKKLGGNP